MAPLEEGTRTFAPVDDIGALEALYRASFERPVVLLKHSLTCSVSADAYDNLSDYRGRIEVISVQSARAVSDEIEARTGIRHESPQVIVLRNGQPVWNASHWRIQTDAVTAAVEENK